MVIQFLGLVAIVIFTVFISRTAKDYGRNALAWSVACIAVGLGVQWFIPILLGAIIGIVLIATGTPPDRVGEAFGFWAVALTIGSFVLSLVGMFLILRKVAELPQEESTAAASPPPPPTFDSDREI